MSSHNRKMIQVIGTSSDAGKSTVAMALCRYISDSGFAVSPFKSVNMSLNSVSVNGRFEIARSQWLQSIASRVTPVPEMNPILLKPEGGMKAQVIVLGESLGKMDYEEYGSFLGKEGEHIIRCSLESLYENSDVVIAEGAGSAAEINLYGRDLANDFVSSIYNTPMILVSDIERGGAFASIYGVVKLMQRPDLLRWIIINKMHGNASLLSEGISKIEALTDKKVIGVVPSFNFTLPGEDSLDYAREKVKGSRICVVRYPHIENYSDIDVLYSSGLGVKFIDGSNIDELNRCEIIILPGSKNVEADLEYLRSTGLHNLIVAAAQTQKKIVGICGGYQMLGREINDPYRTELEKETIQGLSILDCRTTYGEKKLVRNVSYRVDNLHIRSDEVGHGYEIHYGNVTTTEDHAFLIGDEFEGSINRRGNVIGTNIHGILEHSAILSYITGANIKFNYMENLEKNIDAFTEVFVKNTDLSGVLDYLNQ